MKITLIYILFALPNAPSWHDNKRVAEARTFEQCNQRLAQESAKQPQTVFTCQGAVIPNGANI